MRIDLLTVFPRLFDSFLEESLLKKARDKELVDIRVHDIRDHTKDKHRKTDDEPYGHGAGMVMTPQPVVDAIESVRGEAKARTVYLSPAGKPFTQADARRLAGEERLILLCGRYEGVDQRVIDGWVDEEISIGDFILNGGEVAAMAVVESVFRLLPGAIGKEESHQQESFEDGLLEHPHYTRPEEFRGMKAPEVLLSGDHAKVDRWRHDMAVERTRQRRPDLLEKRRAGKVNFSIALVHYPVLGKQGKTITGSITTLDVHDMARLGKTYGANNSFIVTPVEEQFGMVRRLTSHWREGDFLKGEFARRVDALAILEPVESIDAMIKKIKKRSKKVKMLATSAIKSDDAVSAGQWRAMVRDDEEWIILFGTAYGLAPELVQRADALLEPIEGAGEFNHLPVRGASAIIIDRLLGF